MTDHKTTGMEDRVVILTSAGGFKGWFYVIKPRTPWETAYFADEECTHGKLFNGNWIITIDTYDPEQYPEKYRIKDRDNIVHDMLERHGTPILF